MRTYDVVLGFGLIGLALGLAPAASFDGVPEPPAKAVPNSEPRERSVAPPVNAVPRDPARPLPAPAVRSIPPPPAALGATGPLDGLRSGSAALRSGTQALREGKADEAVTALEYAAGQGVPGAMWKLGRMYADGDGVDKNTLRAFEYFRDLTVAHAYDPPNTPQARFVGSAFVALGHIYLEGIPDTYVKPDAVRAHQLYNYAASYFADPDAQYHLARLYREGTGGPKDPRQAVKWLGLAANKGQHQAQATLGAMLFSGKEVARQAAMGLFWLTVAKDSAKDAAKDSTGASERWVSETYASAFAQASEDERALAYRYLENWVRERRR
jgi:TPR repeat protein